VVARCRPVESEPSRSCVRTLTWLRTGELTRKRGRNALEADAHGARNAKSGIPRLHPDHASGEGFVTSGVVDGSFEPRTHGHNAHDRRAESALANIDGQRGSPRSHDAKACATPASPIPGLVCVGHGGVIPSDNRYPHLFVPCFRYTEQGASAQARHFHPMPMVTDSPRRLNAAAPVAGCPSRTARSRGPRESGGTEVTRPSARRSRPSRRLRRGARGPEHVPFAGVLPPGVSSHAGGRESGSA